MIYLASPYVNVDEKIQFNNYFSVMNAAITLYKRNNLLAISPVLHWKESATIFKLPHSMDYWKSFNEKLLSRCDAVYILMLPTLATSKGVRHEFHFAQKQGKQIFMLNPADYHIVPFIGSWEELLGHVQNVPTQVVQVVPDQHP